MAFKYPDRLSEQVLARWAAAGVVGSRPPAAWVMNLAIETAFHAGLRVDEGRQLQFTLLVGSPKDVSRSGANFEPQIFRDPRRLSVAEIAKLSPATSWRHLFICVGPTSGSVCDDAVSELRIWGLLDIGKRWRTYFVKQLPYGETPPDIMVITSHSPGSMAIARSGTTLLKLESGEVAVPGPSILDGGPVALRLKPVCDELSREVHQQIAALGYDSKMEDYPASMYTKFLARVLYHLRDVTHGTAVLFVPDGFNPRDASVVKDLAIKYPVNSRSAWRALVAYYARARERFHLQCSVLESPAELEQTRKLEDLEDERIGADEWLDQFVENVGRFGNVDGAIVLTNKFEILGFGAEIRIDDKSLTLVHRAIDREGKKDDGKPIDDYGTRHRSSFRFAVKYDRAIPFVLSQDGGIKTILYNGRELIYWSAIGGAEHGI